ncbi:inositol-pentakisphosphate 2-kinase [Brienomyrus brachyistius]|uniref:inositol-pentakisphosphate 2-kinase n=1 Tax=Brienomyrus brachyistius TaxID=42636 RepID=UPI0020B3CE84|nr:inositol-pentakisphosphate 2-kinase [Brienomyrus brachyistius]
MELDKMDENDWKYHGEGNKSLVVSHVQHSQVLRLLKYPTEDAEHAHQTSEQAFKHIQNIVEFSKNVMKPLLGETCVHHGEAVKLPLDFLRQLSLKVQHERPESRCDKVMDTFSGCALCLPNLTQLSACRLSDRRPQLCIEIKPKCGFLPSSQLIMKEVKRRVCRFCMHQHFKIANGKWKRMSRYCPLDLFSGNKQRMYLTIKHLLEEPQNNLKIFKNGELIYGCEEVASCQQDLDALAHHLGPYFPTQDTDAPVNELIQAIVGTLLDSPGCDHAGDHWRAPPVDGCTYCEGSPLPCELLQNENHSLPKDCILHRILQAQMLDNLDIEGVYPLYKRVEQYLEEFPKERGKLQLDGPYNEKFLEKLKSCPAEDDGSIEYAVGKVHQYRVSMTAKDCSILIAFSPCGEDELLEPNLDLQTPKPRFTTSVSILDLDPKPYESIAHQYKLDSKIVNYYLWNTQANQNKPHAPATHVYLERDAQDCTLVFQAV